MYHLELIGHAKALLSCCENFELNAIAFSFAESQGRCKRAFEELTNHVTELEKVLLEKRPSVQRWSLAQADRIALCVKGVLGCVKNLIDFNENDVIVVVAQNIELCRKATDALEHAKSHIPKHKVFFFFFFFFFFSFFLFLSSFFLQSNLTNVTDALKDQVANRATVIKVFKRSFVWCFFFFTKKKGCSND
jgi:hypothetical protein